MIPFTQLIDTADSLKTNNRTTYPEFLLRKMYVHDPNCLDSSVRKKKLYTIALVLQKNYE